MRHISTVCVMVRTGCPHINARSRLRRDCGACTAEGAPCDRDCPKTRMNAQLALKMQMWMRRPIERLIQCDAALTDRSVSFLAVLSH